MKLIFNYMNGIFNYSNNGKLTRISLEVTRAAVFTDLSREARASLAIGAKVANIHVRRDRRLAARLAGLNVAARGARRRNGWQSNKKGEEVQFRAFTAILNYF